MSEAYGFIKGFFGQEGFNRVDIKYNKKILAISRVLNSLTFNNIDGW